MPVDYPGTRRCGCCGQVDCTCATCNYVVVLIFCGEREITDQYEVYFQGVLIATITDDLDTEGCRVYVIGDVSDVCAGVITALETEYGEDAVEVAQTTAMNDISECDDEIEGDADCDEVTIEVLPLDGVTVTDLSYKVYTTCHGDGDNVNCCLYAEGGPLTGDGPDEPVSFDWANACCCCCYGLNCLYEPGLGVLTVMNLVSTPFTEIAGVRTYGTPVSIPDETSEDGLISGTSAACNGLVLQCLKSIDIGFTDNGPGGVFTDENGFTIRCINGRMAIVVEPYVIPYWDPGVEEDGIWFSTDDPAASLIYQDDENSFCDEGEDQYSYALFNNIGYEFLNPEGPPGEIHGHRLNFDLLIQCGDIP